MAKGAVGNEVRKSAHLYRIIRSQVLGLGSGWRNRFRIGKVTSQWNECTGLYVNLIYSRPFVVVGEGFVACLTAETREDVDGRKNRLESREEKKKALRSERFKNEEEGKNLW
jgi:hypothetical protein